MKAIHKAAIEKAIALLDASGSEYKIVAPDGKSYGALKVALKKKKKQAHFGYGVFAHLYRPLVDNIKVGEIAEIPYALLESDDAKMKAGFRSSVSAYLSTKWGAGSYTSTNNNGVLQILRVA